MQRFHEEESEIIEILSNQNISNKIFCHQLYQSHSHHFRQITSSKYWLNVKVAWVKRRKKHPIQKHNWMLFAFTILRGAFEINLLQKIRALLFCKHSRSTLWAVHNDHRGASHVDHLLHLLNYVNKGGPENNDIK